MYVIAFQLGRVAGRACAAFEIRRRFRIGRLSCRSSNCIIIIVVVVVGSSNSSSSSRIAKQLLYRLTTLCIRLLQRDCTFTSPPAACCTIAADADVDSGVHLNPLQCNGNYSATSNNMKSVHWPLMGRLLHLVQRRGDWAGPQPAQAPPRCTKCNSPPINGQCTNHNIAVYCCAGLMCR